MKQSESGTSAEHLFRWWPPKHRILASFVTNGYSSEENGGNKNKNSIK